MNIRVIRVLFFVFSLVSGCNLFAQKITIATASNFREPMIEIVDLFEDQYPEFEVRTIYGSSGNLYNQITNGAPFDIFFSANMKYPEKLNEKGLTYKTPRVYAVGQLVLWSRRMNVNQGLSILLDKKVKRIAMANPTLAPYGKSADECLHHFKIHDQLKSKLVIAENIGQTAQFGVTGNADVAFIAKSQLNMKVIKGKGSYFNIPSESYTAIKQACVVIKKEDNELITQKFMDFIFSNEVLLLIERYGYKLPLNE